MIPRSIRILIAEDDFLVSRMVKGMLEETGYNIVGEATSGTEAVEMTSKLKPDVVLMDLEMPEMDGIMATRLILTHCPTPVVVLTAYENHELVEQANAAGVGAYLIKPPKAREIDRAVTIAIGRFQDILALRKLNAELEARGIEREKLVKDLQDALSKIKVLQKLLPICAACKKIRDDKGYWQEVEIYLAKHSDLEFTHGICPSCAQRLYPGLSFQPPGRQSSE